jgi:hypothetical protein
MNNHVDAGAASPPHFPVTSGTESAADGSEADDLKVFERRKQRIRNHLLDSMEHQDTRTSIIGSVSADIMMLQLQVGETLREALGSGRAAPEIVSRNREGIEMLLKLSKLVTQVSQLQRKMLADREALQKGESDKKSEESAS